MTRSFGSASAPPPTMPRVRSSPGGAAARHRQPRPPRSASFVGTFEQRPPAFSARKVAGVVAHRAARPGEPVERTAAQRDGGFDRHHWSRGGGRLARRALRHPLRPGHLHPVHRPRPRGSARLRRPPARAATDRGGGAAGRGRGHARTARGAGPRRAPRGGDPAGRAAPPPAAPAARATRMPAASRMAPQCRAGPASGRHAVFSAESLLGIGVVHDGSLEPRTVVAAAESRREPRHRGALAWRAAADRPGRRHHGRLRRRAPGPPRRAGRHPRRRRRSDEPASVALVFDPHPDEVLRPGTVRAAAGAAGREPDADGEARHPAHRRDPL